MIELGTIKRTIAAHLELRALKRHGSRLGRREAPRYTEYLERCRAGYRRDREPGPEITRTVREFEAKGFTSFRTPESEALAALVLAKLRADEAAGVPIWDADGRYRHDVYTGFPRLETLFRGDLGAFLTAVYRAHFKIFFGILYKSERVADAPAGSQLWHTDGGPGTCINVMFYLSDVVPEDGAMECLPWDASLTIYRKELRSGVVDRRRRGADGRTPSERDVKCEFYRAEIARSFRHRVEQPHGRAGLLVPFRNNILHKGGYPEPGRVRYACVFHCYPSAKPTPFVRYRQLGIPKVSAYPLDPAAEF